MTTLSSFNKTDGVDDHVAADVNNLIAASFRSQYKNVETISATRTLLDVDTPIQRLELGAADRIVKAPTANSVTNHPYLIINASAAARTITFQTNGGTYLASIPQGYGLYAVPDGNGGYKTIPINSAFFEMTEQAAAPATPGTGLWRAYFKSDGLYVKDDAGTESGPLSPAIGGGKYSAFVRCSLATGDPNPVADQSAKTAVYVMPYLGNTIPLWTGADFTASTFAELTATLSATYQTANNVYDVYVWSDSGTIRAGFGVAWTSATSRGTGAGTAEIEVLQGVDVNKNSMTVRNSSSSYTVAARAGTLVATISVSTNGQLNWTDAKREIDNRYNRLETKLHICPNYSDGATDTSYTVNNNTGFTKPTSGQVDFVLGKARTVRAYIQAYAVSSANYLMLAAGFDTITNPTKHQWGVNGQAMVSVDDAKILDIGSHYVSMLMSTFTNTNITIYADFGGYRRGASTDPRLTYLNVYLEM